MNHVIAAYVIGLGFIFGYGLLQWFQARQRRNPWATNTHRPDQQAEKGESR